MKALSMKALLLSSLLLYLALAVMPSSAAGTLALYLPFDEAADAITFDDASGNDFDGICSGDGCPTAGTSGQVDGALQFDGQDDYVQVPYQAALNPAGSFTVAAWVKLDGGSGYRSVITSRDGNQFQGYMIYATETNWWQFWIGTGSQWTMIGSAPVSSEWTHLAGVYDASSLFARFYVNGESQSWAYSGFAANLGQPLRIGAGASESSATFHFPGSIDEVRVYDGALSQTEIAALTTVVRADDDAYTARENTPLSVGAPGVLGNDTGTAGTLTATAETLPAHGVLALELDGAFIYTATFGFTGTDTFTYLASDGTLNDTATVTLTVEPNFAPVAADDAYTTDELTPLTVPAPGVLNNDTDANGDTLTATLTTPPTRGTLSLDPDGSFLYTPALGFPGEYAFEYEASDGTLAGSATVTLTVEANLAPAAQDDAYTVYQNVPLAVAAPGVLDNDSDAHGHTLTATLATAPSHGTVEVQLDGSFTYTPTTDYLGADSFTYTASDGVLDDTATVALTVARPPCQVDSDNDGVTNYASADAGAVQQAVDAAAPGDLIRVAGTCAGVQNRHTWYSQTVYIDRDLTLQGGYSPDDWSLGPDPVVYPTTLDAQRLGRVVYISGTATVTLDGLVVTRGFAQDDSGGGVYSTGTLTVTQSTFENNQSGQGGALYGEGATLFIAGSAFTANHAYDGGGIYVWGNALTLSDTLFYTNTADYDGGALYSENNALTLEEVTLRDNQSGESGGGVYATNSGDGTFFATRSTFQKNHASYRGGALYNTGAPITITHSAFYTNTTGYGNGGAVYATSVSTVLDDVEFSGNAAPVESSGGAVYAGWGSLAVSNATFRHNNAEYQGGAIHAPTSEVTVAYSTFYSNTTHTGGGIHVNNGALDVTHSTFRENEVASNGGGLYAVSSVVTVTQSDFYSNTTLYSEGAGLSMPYSEVLLEDVRFQGNEAQSFGGGIYIYEGDLTMTGGEFRQNRSLDESGGGLYASANSTLNVTQSDFYTNTAHQDGGGIYNGGTFTLTHSLLQGNSALQAGGGVFNTLSNAALNDVTFRHNEATLGGGLYNSGTNGLSNPTLTDVLFEDNEASSGGGLYNYGYQGESSPTLTRVTFSGNSAHYGGGMYNNGGSGISSPTLTDVTFSENTAVTYGGGMVNSGTYGDSSPTLNRVTFRNNTVTGANPAYGGAIYFDAESYGPGGSSTLGATLVNGLFVDNGDQHIAYYADQVITAPHFINCTFSGALSETAYVPRFWSSSPISFTNSIFWGNHGDVTNNDAAVDVTYSVVEEAAYASGTGNTHADPLFVDAASGNLRLRQGSPAIDAGDDGAVPAGATADLDGFERFVWGVDMGAYESQYEEVCEFSAGYPIPLGRVQPITVTFNAEADLGDLFCLTVTYFPTSHPMATVPLQTGAFWTLIGEDWEENPVTSGFTATLTLPFAAADASSRACRWLEGAGPGAGWDCGDGTHTTYDANTWVMRSHVTGFSDWAVGNDVGPTAVTLADLTARGLAIGLSVFSVGALLGLGVVVARRVQSRRGR